MVARETELEKVRRHVREGEARVARQREIVARLPTDTDIHHSAEAFLRTLEDVLWHHQAHLARIDGKPLRGSAKR
jgi:hypothetical protein